MSKNSTTTKKNSGQTPRALSLGEMQRMFDETAEGNLERRRAIAECMRQIGHNGYLQASKESAARLQEKRR